ncbi:hypothetical protein [Mucilaginibacter panaciglaebae]|uniref:Lipoprotein n=1 Tax=Mucilaginibacter panaciglaebae TaxID=502331 RepID=A0ABP7X5M1_9SPHI
MMNRSIVSISLFYCFVAISCKTIEPYDSSELSERTYRDYVLYRCLEKGLDAKVLFSNDLSIGIYDELSEGTISNGEIAQYLDSLVARRVKSIFFPPKLPPDLEGDVAPRTEGRKAIFMSCINYYNSKELRNDIKKVMKMKKDVDWKTAETLKKSVGKKRPAPKFKIGKT